MTTPHHQDKDARINMLLKNPVYLPDAGMIVNLRKALRKMSLNDVCNLSLIVDLKTDAAVADAAKERPLPKRTESSGLVGEP